MSKGCNVDLVARGWEQVLSILEADGQLASGIAKAQLLEEMPYEGDATSSGRPVLSWQTF